MIHSNGNLSAPHIQAVNESQPSVQGGLDLVETEHDVSGKAAIIEEAIGAIVVPSYFSERIYRALVAVDGWMEKLWNVTEFELDGGTVFTDLQCTELLHAVHLSRRGAGILNALSLNLSQRQWYHLTDVLDIDTELPANLERRLVRQDLDVADRKILQKLRAACSHLELLGHPNFVFWVPGLSPVSWQCSRHWEAPLYEAWHNRKNLQPSPRFTFVDLFAGIGGFRLGLEALDGRCVLACEENPHARATYRRNFGEADGPAHPVVDIRCVNSTDVPAFDILAAGFPCQPFTELACGQRQGLNCEDGQIVHELVRILGECQPAAALLENVAGLLTINHGSDFKKIVSALRGAGYAVGWQLISAEHFVPQVRLRLYIVCIRLDLHKPGRNHQPTLALNSQCQDGAFGGDEVIKWLDVESWKLNADRSKPLVKGILENDASKDILDASTLSEDQLAKVIGFEARGSRLRRGGLEKRLVETDGQALTLRSTYKQNFRALSQFVPQPDSRPRFFTTRECARLMGFPDSFEPGVPPQAFVNFQAPAGSAEGYFYHQLGNAVVPAVIQEISSRILDVIDL